MKNKNEIADYLRELAGRIENATWIQVQDLIVERNNIESVGSELPLPYNVDCKLSLRWKETIP